MNLKPKSPRSSARSPAVKFSSHEDYIASVAPAAQDILRRVQRDVQASLPQAQPCISYSMPAYRLGRVFFYFAAFKNHLGVYPPVTDDAALVRELAPFRNAKGNLSFPYRDPIPYDLIVRVALALARQYGKGG